MLPVVRTQKGIWILDGDVLWLMLERGILLVQYLWSRQSPQGGKAATSNYLARVATKLLFACEGMHDEYQTLQVTHCVCYEWQEYTFASSSGGAPLWSTCRTSPRAFLLVSSVELEGLNKVKETWRHGRGYKAENKIWSLHEQEVPTCKKPRNWAVNRTWK